MSGGPALAVPFRDARAADLRLSFDARRHTALRTICLPLGDVTVELRVLGASHQVVVRAEDRHIAAETLACGLGGQPLPATADWTDEGWAIRFSARVRILHDAAFAATVGRLRDALASCGCAVTGVFPGDALALTGLRAWELPGPAVTWRTWHAYPQTRELVTTWSTAQAVSS